MTKKQPDLNQLAKQIKQMQDDMVKTREELAEKTVTASAGGGAVQVVITGHQRIQSITINSAVIDEDDLESLQDLLVAAVNNAIEKSQAMAAERLEGLTGGLNLPGL